MPNRVVETLAASAAMRPGTGVPGHPTLDTQIFLHINAFARATPWLHPIVSAYLGTAALLFVGLALTGLFVARRRMSATAMAAALWAPVATVIAARLNQPLAAAVGKVRPYVAHSGVLALTSRAGPSFPSHRAVEIGAIAAGMLLVHRYLAVTAVIAALTVGFADVYTAAHYPQDELAGFVVGAAICLIGFDLTRRPLCWSLKLLGRTRFRRLITVTPG
ncbi:phosphatase PAP2 family protein [Nocardia sp. NBC_01388]|uniref:phosphatase PAP2 family protein n=1 Tax=Nocardia sp. NBC_01388 TaxID=2903596 RepID=UPI00324BF430